MGGFNGNVAWTVNTVNALRELPYHEAKEAASILEDFRNSCENHNRSFVKYLRMAIPTYIWRHADQLFLIDFLEILKYLEEHFHPFDVYADRCERGEISEEEQSRHARKFVSMLSDMSGRTEEFKEREFYD